ARGRRHPLTAFLSLAVVALLAGMKSLEAIAQFGRDQGPGLAHALSFRRKKTPAKSTLSKIFRSLDREAFEAPLATCADGRPAAGDAIALDGKTLKGSRDGEVPGVPLLAAFAPHSAAVLAVPHPQVLDGRGTFATRQRQADRPRQLVEAGMGAE